MKKLLLITLSLVPFLCFSQDMSKYVIEADGEYLSFEDVVKSDSTLKAGQLYSKGVEWFATTYKNSRSVLQMQDKESGIIIGKACFGLRIPPKGIMPSFYDDVFYTIKIYFKDGRIKYSISQFNPEKQPMGIMKTGSVTKWPPMSKKLSIRLYDEYRDLCKAEALKIGNDLKYYFTNSSELKKEW